MKTRPVFLSVLCAVFTVIMSSCTSKEPAEIAVESIKLSATNLELYVGEQKALNVTISPSNATNKRIVWTSSRPNVVSVTNDGVLEGRSAGNAVITATSADGNCKANCEVIVKNNSIPVTKISLDKTAITMTEGDTQTLTATIKPDNATVKSIIWTSSDEHIATVDDGTITAVSPGTATVTASADGKSAICKITVEKKHIAVTSISLDKTDITLTEGDTQTLTATVKPDDATDKTVTWSSSDEHIATVDNGTITAVSPGTATITASADGKSATCKITVEKKHIAVTSISLDKTDITLTVGDTWTLVATVKPDDATDKTVTWTSSNKSIATVNEGKITALSLGTTTITATAEDQTATCSVVVYKKGSYIDEYGVNQGQGITIDGITWAPVNCGFKEASGGRNGFIYGKLYQWGRKDGQGYGRPYFNSSDTFADESTPTIATSPWIGKNEDADPDTFYSGSNEPYDWITTSGDYWNDGTESAPVKSELHDPCPAGWRIPTISELESLAYGYHSDLVQVNGVYGAWYSGNTLYSESVSKKIFLPAGGGRFADNWFHRSGAVGRGSGGSYWASSQKDGYAYTIGFLDNPGTSYKAFGYSVRCCKDEVVTLVPITGLSISAASLSLSIGDKTKLTVTLQPSNTSYKAVFWSSDNESVASVSTDGTVLALSEGQATITAKVGEKTATCTVSVQKKYVAVTSVTLNKTGLSLNKGQSETLSATVKPDDATNKTVTWSSSNTKTATVDSNGKVTAVAGGTVTIRAKAGDKQATCTVTVSVPVESVSINSENVTLEVGGYATLTATVKPDDATDKTVSWSSSNTSIATIDQNGKVTGVKEGKATVTAKAGGKTATCTVTVKKGDPLILSATSIDADCLDGATVSVQVEAESMWTVKETGNSILSLSKESGDAGIETLTITIVGANCTNSERTSTLLFECGEATKYLKINQLPAFHFDSLDQEIPSSGGSYQFSFQYAKNNGTRSLRYSGDDGFNNLRNSSAFDDISSPLAIIDYASTDGPVMTTFKTSISYKPNYSKNSRTGRFRVFFEEDGQTLYSEWINVSQLPDEIAGEESDGVSTVIQQHTKGSGVPVVILGDGFTKSDINNGTFKQAADLAYEYFFSVEPLTSLQEYFDVWSITAVSTSRTFNGSGTRFGCKNTNGTRIEGNDELVYHYAAKVVPSNKLKDMLVIVVMNTNIYAGTCSSYYLSNSSGITFTYSIAYTPMTNKNGITLENVIHHEACGHGLGKLADEYSGTSAITSSAKTNLAKFHEAGGYVNVDVYSDVSKTLWAKYAEDTRFSYESIGAYEGAYTYKSGVYRPTQTSIMNDNVGIFNAPSRAQIYRRVLSIAHDWNWTFDYETFVSFDAAFRQRNYSSTSMQASNRQSSKSFIPLAPPVLIEDDESKYF